MIKRLLLCIAATLFSCASIVMPVKADETKGAIEINYSCDDVHLSDAGISIYKIADATLTDKTIVYSFVDELSSYSKLNKFGRETYFDGMTAAESNTAAKAFAKENLVATNMGLTDKNGNCSFAGLEPGMYMITQISAKNVSADYTWFEPFLVSVPLVDENKEYQFEIKVKPKTDVEKIPESTTPTETTPAETTTPGSPILGIEDHSWLLSVGFASLAGVFVLSGIWYVIAVIVRKKHRA